MPAPPEIGDGPRRKDNGSSPGCESPALLPVRPPYRNNRKNQNTALAGSKPALPATRSWHPAPLPRECRVCHKPGLAGKDQLFGQSQGKPSQPARRPDSASVPHGKLLPEGLKPLQRSGHDLREKRQIEQDIKKAFAARFPPARYIRHIGDPLKREKGQPRRHCQRRCRDRYPAAEKTGIQTPEYR